MNPSRVRHPKSRSPSNIVLPIFLWDMIVCDLDTTSVRTWDVLPSEKFEGSRLNLDVAGRIHGERWLFVLACDGHCRDTHCCDVMLNYLDLYSTLHVWEFQQLRNLWGGLSTHIVGLFFMVPEAVRETTISIRQRRLIPQLSTVSIDFTIVVSLTAHDSSATESYKSRCLEGTRTQYVHAQDITAWIIQMRTSSAMDVRSSWSKEICGRKILC